MQYTIRHVTRFTYEAPISESVMEARMQPCTDGSQRCIRFGLSTTPPSRDLVIGPVQLRHGRLRRLRA